MISLQRAAALLTACRYDCGTLPTNSSSMLKEPSPGSGSGWTGVHVRVTGMLTCGRSGSLLVILMLPVLLAVQLPLTCTVAFAPGRRVPLLGCSVSPSVSVTSHSRSAVPAFRNCSWLCTVLPSAPVSDNRVGTLPSSGATAGGSTGSAGSPSSEPESSSGTHESATGMETGPRSGSFVVSSMLPDVFAVLSNSRRIVIVSHDDNCHYYQSTSPD